jgi:hypothetical protein
MRVAPLVKEQPLQTLRQPVRRPLRPALEEGNEACGAASGTLHAPYLEARSGCLSGEDIRKLAVSACAEPAAGLVLLCISLDTQNSIESCGGCWSDGTRTDCTAFDDLATAICTAGKCECECFGETARRLRRVSDPVERRCLQKLVPKATVKPTRAAGRRQDCPVRIARGAATL